MAPKAAAAPIMEPERIGDVDEGYTPETPEVDEMGLTADERAEFDNMREADKTIPEGPEEPAEAGEGEGATGEPKPTLDAPPAPVAPQKKVPEPPEEDDEPDQVTRDPKTGKEQRTISYGKHQRLLKKEREQAEAMRAQAEQQRIDHAKLSERLQILNDALSAPPPPQPQTPQEIEYARQQEIAQNPMLEETIDPAVDLAGAILQMQRRQIFMTNASMMQQEATQEALADQSMLQSFTRDANLFSQTEEGQHFFGMEGAYQFLKNSRLCELALNLFDKDATDPNERFTQAELDKMVAEYNAEEKSLVNNALQAGRSPAKAILRHAKGRGWRPPQPAAAAAQPTLPAAAAPAARQPAARAAPAATAPARTAVAQLQAEQAGAAASRSLSDGGGSPPAEPLSMQQLLDMDDEEFGLYVDNLPPARLQAIMGREFPGRR